jgi:mono/diheme cytochrome c family protein
MDTRIRVDSGCLVLTLTLFGTIASATAGGATPADPSARGWYTKDQAERGHSEFNNYCAECHRPDLTGADGPPLKGDQFLGKWGNQTLGDLYAFEHQTMPAQNPGSVSDEMLLAITAYILERNGFPSGTAPLAKDARMKMPLKK